MHLIKILEKFFKKSTILKYGFNFNAAYRRSTGQVYFVSDDLKIVKVKMPLTNKNRNYKGTMFGGAMFSATDPFYMIQLITILGDNYVVWDKSASIQFKRPSNQTLYAEFNLSNDFIEQIIEDVKVLNETQYNLSICLTDKDGIVYAEIEREIYIASKNYYKAKSRVKPLTC